MKIGPMEGALIHANGPRDRRRDMTKLIIAFR